MASSVKHCTLNDKGLKQYQKRVKAVKGGQVDPTSKNYANAKLPAHKAAFEGNIPGLEAILISKVETGGISAADKGITPLHAHGNQIHNFYCLLHSKYNHTGNIFLIF